MKLKIKILLSVIFLVVLSGYIPGKKEIPRLGIVAPLDQDSLIYASGFRMLGQSVGKMLSPSLTEEQFQLNLIGIKKARCKVFLCNIFFPGSIKIAGPAVEENRVLDYADTVFKCNC